MSETLSIYQDEQETVSSRLDQIAPAFVAAQAELTSIGKDSKGYGYTYSDLNSVINTVRPILAKHGLSQLQLIGETNENVQVTTLLLHTSGQFIQTVSSLPVIDMKGCNAAQGAGASISYLRRYALQAILGIASEDNDASSAGPAKKAPAKSSSSGEAKKVPFERTAKKKTESDGGF